nr:acetylxylan esterase [Kibdelosporangium sp. MJ126-NF4]CEL20634.1 Acetyl xylan esterase [Kibdelosporangium sp. MJ126-NF4]CTQ89546.1 Acetyl xylan esterase [Kibdelosporangium sp. MJ126-NF4]
MTEFDEYWHAVDDELAALPARPVADHAPVRSTGQFSAYDVRLTSVGPYRIFGYLSVPTGDGPFPAVLETPRYGSVNQPPHYRDRLRYITFTVMHRGQRLADVPFKAAYPGLATLGIEDPATYVYRAIVADCLRGAEFLLGHELVDPARVGVTGDDLALITASRRPGFRAARSTGPLEALAELTGPHPTTEFFAPERHPCGADTFRVGTDYELTHEDSADDEVLDTWLAQELGVSPIRRFDLMPS